MRIGILGSGEVGQALAAGFLQHGHDVMLGTRDVTKPELRAWRDAAGARAQLGTFAETATFADLALLATAWSGTEAALQLAGPGAFAGKIVIDVTNPLAHDADGMPHLALGTTDSGAEQVQRWLPGARVVKAFNTINSSAMVHPTHAGGPPTMFIAGDDTEARAAVRGIAETFGWAVAELDSLSGARYLEPLAMLWVHYAIQHDTWDHAFALLWRATPR